MADLESKILKERLVDDEIDDARHESSASESGSGDEGADAGASESGMRAAVAAARVARDPLGQREGGPGGGAKAVRADKAWADFQATKAADREAAKAMDLVRRAGYGSTMSAHEESVSLAYQLGKGRSAGDASDAGKEEDEDDEEEGAGGAGATAAASGAADDEADEAALRQWLASRRRELISATAGPQYGAVEVVTEQLELPDAIDRVPAPALVLLLLEEQWERAATVWCDAWTALAPAHPGTKFMRIQASVASDSFDPLGIPSLVVYRGGAVVASWIRLQADAEVTDTPGGIGTGLGDMPSIKQIEQWLIAQKLIAAPASSGASSTAARTGGSGSGRSSGGSGGGHGVRSGKGER